MIPGLESLSKGIKWGCKKVFTSVGILKLEKSKLLYSKSYSTTIQSLTRDLFLKSTHSFPATTMMALNMVKLTITQKPLNN